MLLCTLPPVHSLIIGAGVAICSLTCSFCEGPEVPLASKGTAKNTAFCRVGKGNKGISFTHKHTHRTVLSVTSPIPTIVLFPTEH